MKHVINIADKETLDKVHDNTTSALETIEDNTNDIKDGVQNSTDIINSNTDTGISKISKLITDLANVVGGGFNRFSVNYS